MRLVQYGLKYFALHILLYLAFGIVSLLESLIKQRVVASQHKYKIEPALRKEVTPVVVDQIAALLHRVVQLVNNLVLVELIRLQLGIIVAIKVVLLRQLRYIHIIEASQLGNLF